MGKSSTIDSYFKRKTTTEDPSTSDVPFVGEIPPDSKIPPASESPTAENRSTKFQRIKISEFDVISFESEALMNQSINIQTAFENITPEQNVSEFDVISFESEALMNQSINIQTAFENITPEQNANNRVLLKAIINAVRYFTFQGIAIRGYDESIGSTDRGDVYECLSFWGSYNEQLRAVMLDIAPRNFSCFSSKIQKDICHCFATKVKNSICEEIGDSKFCLLIDGACDVQMKEHMSLVLRFVDKDGFVQERFFGLVHVSNIMPAVLKDGIYSVLSNHNLDIQNIRGQGYNAASDMHGEWNDLQTLISKDCQYAYHVHCFAQLQLALVEASKEVFPVYDFFAKLSSIVTLVGASSKHSEETKDAQVYNNAHLISRDELMTESGLNQIGTLQGADDISCSHYKSVSSLINMFSATCQVLINFIDGESTLSQRGEANSAYSSLTSFEFIFILHLMKKIMATTDFLCQTLHCQSQDILNAMKVVSLSKKILQELRDEEWDSFLTSVKSFCEENNIDVPNMKVCYVVRGVHTRKQQGDFTVEHRYRMDIFSAVINSQLQELNILFNENAMELLMLSSSLDPRSECVKTDDVCHLVHKFYPQDFNDQEKMKLGREIQNYASNVVQLAEYKNFLSVSELCQWLVRTRRSTTYPLVFRVIVLILTLPHSIATTGKSFSAMSVLKTAFCGEMEDKLLSDSLIMYIEREIAEKFSTVSIIDDVQDMKERRVSF